MRGIGSLASMSALTSPRSGSGMATPTASGTAAMQAATLLSPGSFFSTSLRIPSDLAASFGGLGPPARSGAATPGAASFAGLVPAPATPKRDMSGQRLSELVHHPMAAAAAAAGAGMAEQERECFSQLAAEASAPGTATNPTANGTPAVLSGFNTPVGSLGGSVPASNPLTGTVSLGPFGAAPAAAGRPPGGLTVAVASSLNAGAGAGGGAVISRYSSSDMLAAVSPRWPGAGGAGTPLTPTRSNMPAVVPLLMADRELIGRKLAHAFPWNPTAQVGTPGADSSCRDWDNTGSV